MSPHDAMLTQLAKHYVLTSVRSELEELFEHFDKRFRGKPEDQKDFLEEIHAAFEKCLDDLDGNSQFDTS